MTQEETRQEKRGGSVVVLFFFFLYSLHWFSWEPDGTINPQSTQEYQVALTPAWGTLPSSVVSPWLMSIQLNTLTQLAVWICSPIWQMGRVSLSLAAASEIFPDISQTADPPSAQPSIFCLSTALLSAKCIISWRAEKLKVTIQGNFNVSTSCGLARVLSSLNPFKIKHHFSPRSHPPLGTAAASSKFHHTYFDVVTLAWASVLKCACKVCKYIFIHKHHAGKQNLFATNYLAAVVFK